MAPESSESIPTTTVTLPALLANLDRPKSTFIQSTETAVNNYVCTQDRSACFAIVEVNGLSNGTSCTHRPGLNSYLKVLGCFVFREPYHKHPLDSALSAPIAGIVSDKYAKFLGSKTSEIEEYFLSLIKGDDLIRRTLMTHVAAELGKKGIKIAQKKLIDLLIHSMTLHATHTHVGIAVQHSVVLATQHTTAVAAGTSAATAAGSVITALLVKALATHISVILPKLVSSAALKALILATTHKVVCTAATVAVANTLAAKLGTVGAVTFLHLFVAPLAIGFIAYKVKCLVRDLGRNISKGVREDLEGKFRSITQAVIEGMKNEICDMDGMASAIVGEIITLDG